MEGVQVGALGYALSTQYQKHRSNLAQSLSRLASGSRLDLPNRNPADQGIASKMLAEIRGQEAGLQNLQVGINVLNTGGVYMNQLSDILMRMTELAGAASVQPLDGNTLPSETSPSLTNLNIEYQSLLREYRSITRNSSFQEVSLVGQEPILSFDESEGKMQFWTASGGNRRTLSSDLSSDAVDVNGNELLFDASRSYTMSHDGKYLYYIGGSGAAGYDLRRLNVSSGGIDLILGGAALSVDEGSEIRVNTQGDVYVTGVLGGAGRSLYETSAGDDFATVSQVGSFSDLVGNSFAVYDSQLTYWNGTNVIEHNMITDVQTASGGSPGAITGGAVKTSEMSFSYSGKLLADGNDTNTDQIRVYDHALGQASTLTLTGQTIENLTFNSDGDRIYYVDTSSRSIRYVSVSQDQEGQVALEEGSEIIYQAKQADDLTGLSLGGAGAFMHGKMATGLDANNLFHYTMADARLWKMGLLDSDISTQNQASAALEDLKSAMNLFNQQRTVLSTGALRMQMQVETQRSSLSYMEAAESRLRDIDIAKETIEVAELQMKTQAAMAVLGQFPSLLQSAARLLMPS